MVIDPRRLKVLLDVYRAGSVTSAARILHLTPSAVSQQLARLESETGSQVVIRQASGVALTAAGRLLVETAERIESELLDARQSLLVVEGHTTGKVTIGAFRTAARALFVPLVRRLQDELPGVEVSVHETDGEAALQGMRSGFFDLLVIEAESPLEATPTGHRDVAIYDEPWRIVTPTSIPRPRTISDLAGVTWLGTDPRSATHRATQRIHATLAYPPLVRHVFTDFEVAIEMVAQELGVALLPSLAVPNPLPANVRSTSLPGLGARGILLRHRLSRTEPRREVIAVIDAALAAAGELDLSV